MGYGGVSRQSEGAADSGAGEELLRRQSSARCEQQMDAADECSADAVGQEPNALSTREVRKDVQAENNAAGERAVVRLR